MRASQLDDSTHEHRERLRRRLCSLSPTQSHRAPSRAPPSRAPRAGSARARPLSDHRTCACVDLAPRIVARRAIHRFAVFTLHPGASSPKQTRSWASPSRCHSTTTHTARPTSAARSPPYANLPTPCDSPKSGEPGRARGQCSRTGSSTSPTRDTITRADAASRRRRPTRPLRAAFVTRRTQLTNTNQHAHHATRDTDTTVADATDRPECRPHNHRWEGLRWCFASPAGSVGSRQGAGPQRPAPRL